MKEQNGKSKEELKLLQKKSKTAPPYNIDFLSIDKTERVCNYHKSFPVYSETPLAKLDGLAGELGLGGIYVKDESCRFGLQSFKVLGGSFAMGSYLAKKLGMDISELTFDRLTSDEICEKSGDITFVTATDGNHGRGVAWTANQLKKNAVVYMPKGSSEQRLENIRKEGAQASITDMNYDDTVRLAGSMAHTKGWVMVQDTAWEGYTDIPALIIQGYATMGVEAHKQLLALGEKPTHIFIQAGVGSLAASITGFFAGVYGEDRPIITVVEPNKADCIYKTAEANDGKLRFVTGDMDTIMAGLACGEPCTVGWNILNDYADNFISCPDYIAAKGMRVLGNPCHGDVKIESGESGAVTLGLVAELMQNPEYRAVKDALGLGDDSKVLCFSTEGATDWESYKSIVWDGAYTGVKIEKKITIETK